MLRKLFKRLDLYLLSNSPLIVFSIIFDRILFAVFYKYYYQFRFMNYGNNIRWGRDFRYKVIPTTIRISCPEKIYLGNNLQIDEGVFLQSSESGDGIKIDDGTRINRDVHILAGSKITIGKKVLIAPRVLICSNNHAYHQDIPVMDQGMKFSGEIQIHDGCWISQSAIVLGDCIIAKNSVVAANVKISKKSILSKKVIYE